jgi:hypothetical protein
MIFDGMLPDIASILDELVLQLADQVFYGGVNAGSAQFQPIPCLFDQYQSMMHGVLCLLLPGQRQSGHQPWLPHADTVHTATATASNRIFQIDWRPAFEAYQHIVKQQFGAAADRDNFYTFGVHFPLGIMLANQQLLIRIPVALEDDGSVFCVRSAGKRRADDAAGTQPPGENACDKCWPPCNSATAISARALLSFTAPDANMHFGPAALMKSWPDPAQPGGQRDRRADAG